MNAIRKILMPLMIVPLGMFIYVFTHPDWQWESPGLDSLFAVISIPIIVINFLAWFYPEIIKAYFPVKESWDQRNGKPVIFAMTISALIAMACVGVGAASAISRDAPRLIPRSLAARPSVVADFTHSAELLPDSANAGENDVVSILTASPKTAVPTEQTLPTAETSLLPESTPQIPVSGGAAISTPTLPALAVTQPEATSAFAQATQPTSQATSQATSTGVPAGACVAASQDMQDTVSQAVQDGDPDNQVDKGWAVQSKSADNLWFVAAKIHGPQVTATQPGVWGIFVYSDYLDIYAINDVAVELSYADTGNDSDPVISMQSDGAQAAYDCAVRAR